MTEQQQAVARVAIGALVDAYAREPDVKATKFVTVEVELAGGKPVEARAWIERRCSVNKLLGAGRG
jgi:hypothetical protein